MSSHGRSLHRLSCSSPPLVSSSTHQSLTASRHAVCIMCCCPGSISNTPPHPALQLMLCTHSLGLQSQATTHSSHMGPSGELKDSVRSPITLHIWMQRDNPLPILFTCLLSDRSHTTHLLWSPACCPQRMQEPQGSQHKDSKTFSRAKAKKALTKGQHWAEGRWRCCWQLINQQHSWQPSTATALGTCRD